ncbi:zinc finger and SCAN domain containing 2, partial [Chelydra serpentina]
QSFGDSAALAEHQELHAPCICPECGQSCKDSAALTRHQITHMREKLYKCPDCGQSFGDISALTQHQRNHIREKLRCPDCGQGLGASSGPGARQRGRATAKPVHDCSAAGARERSRAEGEPVRDRSELGVHDRGRPAADPFPDGSTSSSRPGSGEMASLIRRPATEPYKCHDCGQSFAEGSGLSRHLASHPKPFRCPECGRGFPDTGALARHREVHAGGEPAGPGEKSRKSCAEISAVLLRQGNHVAGRGPRSRAADDALPPGALAPARPRLQPAGRGPATAAHRDGRMSLARPECGKGSQGGSVLLQHLQNHVGDRV